MHVHYDRNLSISHMLKEVFPHDATFEILQFEFEQSLYLTTLSLSSDIYYHQLITMVICTLGLHAAASVTQPDIFNVE